MGGYDINYKGEMELMAIWQYGNIKGEMELMGSGGGVKIWEVERAGER